ncbi:uncharacterized protein LOC110641929 isoform X2 [Hevea brasiliensis]|uniref:uncharacterized protein LOC110641929 isoform X2 n=1 Tax=Hevea brasiliensis TaxID=3981 RepID=UPI0025E9A1CC|nr:uncharacterized protein LOC110641929 isoform X2 [Hevea brasiliensis]
MSSSTIFIAVQCCQCSTMQVKQQKKSSNKWTCAVCNQKQSVRKLFAHGYMAKDLRKFVQSFNMSRKFADDGQQHESLTSVTSPCDAGLLEDQQRKRRSNWSEYLDPEENGSKEKIKPEEEEEDDFGSKIVTEWPRDMFKKPKLRDQASGSDNGDGDRNSYKPVFSTKTNQEIVSQGKEKIYQPAKIISASKWSDYMTEDYKEQRTAQPTMATKASKWNAYVTHDHSSLKVGNRRNFADDMGQYSHDIWETILDDQKVEDDIHPDFM